MTDHELRELLQERVGDLTAPDLSGRAWERASRIRRRRTAGVVAGAVASVAVVAVALAGAPGLDRSSGPDPATQRPSPAPSTAPPAPPSPSTPRKPGTPAPSYGAQATDPDGRFQGWPVYWGPTAGQEETLPPVPTPIAPVVDLSAAAPDLAGHPIREALAAYALIDDAGGSRLLLLAPDGSLRSVDTSRVAPYDDGTGHDVSVAHETLLSPTGEYLAFPQAGHVAVLTLATGAWRDVDTGSAPTGAVHWLGVTDLWLPPTFQGGQGPLYSVVDGSRVGSAGEAAPLAPFDPGAEPYGRWRMGPGGTAQVWTGVAGLPVVADERTPSQVLLVQGDAPARDALLVLGDSTSPIDHERPEDCCGVKFWLGEHTVVYESASDPRRLIAWQVGTHGVGVVSTLRGYDADRTTLVSSYARIWDR